MLLPQSQEAGCGLLVPCPEGHLIPRARPSPNAQSLLEAQGPSYSEPQISAELPPGLGTGASLDFGGVESDISKLWECNQIHELPPTSGVSRD